MDNNKRYPELIDYIFFYCSKFFTEDEMIANRYFTAMVKSHNGKIEPFYNMFMKDFRVTKAVEDFYKLGFDEFKIITASRIYFNHKEALELNLCPKCSKIARTPMAKQCRFCCHSWRGN